MAAMSFPGLARRGSSRPSSALRRAMNARSSAAWGSSRKPLEASMRWTCPSRPEYSRSASPSASDSHSAARSRRAAASDRFTFTTDDESSAEMSMTPKFVSAMALAQIADGRGKRLGQMPVAVPEEEDVAEGLAPPGKLAVCVNRHQAVVPVAAPEIAVVVVLEDHRRVAACVHRGEHAPQQRFVLAGKV